MDEKLKEIQTELTTLAKDIMAGRFARAKRPWGGADVVIASEQPMIQGEKDFYPEPRYVVTPFDLELSGLFESLRNLFSPVPDGTSKIEFYGRLAKAAKSLPDES
jgi:hypothetical protein